MVSFQRLWENMQGGADGDKPMDAIRTGLNVREDFWDDFLLVLNHSDALAELLQVSPVKISGWHSRVREYLEKVKAADAVPDPKKRGKVIHAGADDPFGGGSDPAVPEGEE